MPLAGHVVHFDPDPVGILEEERVVPGRERVFAGRVDDRPAETDDDVLKGMLAHGVSVIEIAPGDGGWQMVQDSPYNRRITLDIIE